MSTFGNSFVQAFNPAFRQSVDAAREDDRLRLQSVLQEQAHKQALVDAMAQWRQQQAEMNAARVAEEERQRQAALAAQARSFNLNPSQPQRPAGWSVQPAVAAQPPIPLEYAVRQAQEREQLNQKTRAKALGARDQLAAGIAELKGIPGADAGEFANLDPATIDDNKAIGLVNNLNGRLSAARQVYANNAKESAQVKNMKEMLASRGIDPESDDGKKELSYQLEYNTLSGPDKLAHLQARELQQSGLIGNDRRSFEKERARLAAFGGHNPNLTDTQVQTLLGDKALVGNIDNVLGGINKFEAKYGPGSFDAYVGPISNRLQKAKMTIDGNDPQANDANGVLQLFQDVMNAKIRDVSGAQTSAQEILRNMLAAGDPKMANFKSAMANWRNNTATIFNNRLKAAEGFNVPSSLTPFDLSAPQASPASPAGSASPASANPADAILSKYGIK